VSQVPHHAETIHQVQNFLSSQNYLDIPYKAQYIGTLLRVLRLLSVERENSGLLEMMAEASSLIVHQFKLQ